MNWNWDTDTIIGSPVYDRFVHIQKHAINWNINPVLPYSTNRGHAQNLLKEINSTDNPYTDTSSPVRIYTKYSTESGGYNNKVYVGEFLNRNRQKKTLYNTSYSALVTQIYLSMGQGKANGYKKGDNGEPEWRFGRQGIGHSGAEYKYFNITNNRVQKSIYYSDTITPGTYAYIHHNNTAKLSQMGNARRRNVGMSTIRTKKLRRVELERKPLGNNRVPITPVTIGDPTDYNYYENLICEYNAYAYDPLLSDVNVINGLVQDCSVVGSIDRVLNTWENSTICDTSPEAQELRTMSMINLNMSTTLTQLVGPSNYNQ